MGCVSSSPEIEDTSKPIFHVWNVDDQGNEVNAGKIQVTESDLVLYQRGKSPVVWPLRSLRRYGFDAELFSFECGRRCPTGSGIYAFKCRRAEALFNVLQEGLQNSVSASEIAAEGAIGGESGGEEQPGATAPDASTDALVSEERPERDENHVGNNEQDSLIVLQPDIPLQPTAPQNSVSSPTSPLYTALSSNRTGTHRRTFEYTQVPLPRCCTIGTCMKAHNLNMLNEDVFRRATCGTCRTCSLNMCVMKASFANSATAVENIKKSQHHEDIGNVLDQTGHLRNCVHCCCSLVPSSQFPCSADNCPVHCNNCVDQVTNYTRLDDLLKQEASNKKKETEKHFYMNVAPGKANGSARSRSASWRSLPHCSKFATHKKRLAPRRSSSHFYANVSCNPEKATDRTSNNDNSAQDTDQQVNYIVLDLDQNAESSAVMSPSTPPSVQSAVSQESLPFKTPEGYATIDFDKTTALSNSTNTCLFDDDSVRKTRHNGSISNSTTSPTS